LCEGTEDILDRITPRTGVIWMILKVLFLFFGKEIQGLVNIPMSNLLRMGQVDDVQDSLEDFQDFLREVFLQGNSS